jgi:hypothetical protein
MSQIPAVQPDVILQNAQFRSIAEELVIDFRIHQGQSFTVTIESQQQKTALENILLEVLKGQGAIARLLTGETSETDSVLRVAVLTQEIVRNDVGNGSIERKAQMIVDARIETSSGEVPAQKVFQRSARDTLRTESRQMELTVFERLLEPAIVIAGAILVVYLLFTVRST